MGKIAMIIVAILAILGVDFLLTAGIIWLICLGLAHLGVAISFSWWLVLVVWLILNVLNCLFAKAR